MKMTLYVPPRVKDGVIMSGTVILCVFLGVWGFNLSLDESIGILLVSVLIATVIRYVIMQDKRIV